MFYSGILYLYGLYYGHLNWDIPAIVRICSCSKLDQFFLHDPILHAAHVFLEGLTLKLGSPGRDLRGAARA
jgi:hypothetical protein